TTSCLVSASQISAMLFLPLQKSICQRCVGTQLTNHLWLSIGNIRQFTTHHHLQNVRKSVSKHVKADSGSFGQKAKEATRTTYYTTVVVLGVGVTGLMMYAIFKELLSSFSPQTVYSAAVEKCISHPRVIDFLGDSVKSYGEESRRGRRQHIRHLLAGNSGTCLCSLTLTLMRSLLLRTIGEQCLIPPNHQDFQILLIPNNTIK
ncbi:hypothetical protein OTU49_001408, partial [Cherax quadricarinatus]